MTRIIDQFSDPSFKPVIRIINENPQVKELTKHASLDYDERDSLPDYAFAWPEERLFRIDSRDNAVLSKLFIEKQASYIPAEVKQRCDTVLQEIYGVNPNEIKLVEKTANTAVTKYVYPEEKKLPIRTKQDYKVACETLSQNLRRMPLRARTYTAMRLVKLGSELDESPPDWALQYSGISLCDRGQLQEAIEMRISAAPNSQLKYAYDRLLDGVSQLPSFYNDFDDLVKFASVLEQLDQIAGFDTFYSRALPDPMISVFNTAKIASDLITLAGVQVPLEALLRVPVDVYAQIFGEELIPEITTNGKLDPEKLMQVLPTMPVDLLKIFLNATGAANG